VARLLEATDVENFVEAGTLSPLARRIWLVVPACQLSLPVCQAVHLFSSSSMHVGRIGLAIPKSLAS